MNDPTTPSQGHSDHRLLALSDSQLVLLCLLLGAVLIVEIIALVEMPDGKLHVAYLDVGQGDAILITTPVGNQVLIDGGPEPSRLIWALSQELPVWDRSLDLVILTHADSDHMDGMIPLFERYRIDAALTSEAVMDSAEAESWRRVASESADRTVLAHRGFMVTVDDRISMQVLHPPHNLSTNEGHDNNLSIVMRLEYGLASFLFTGDLEAVGELALLASEQSLQADVLKVSHHGSNSASCDRFLAAVHPSYAIIQVGSHNQFGHPDPDALARLENAGAQVLRTDLDGTVEMVSDGSQLSVHTNG